MSSQTPSKRGPILWRRGSKNLTQCTISSLIFFQTRLQYSTVKTFQTCGNRNKRGKKYNHTTLLHEAAPQPQEQQAVGVVNHTLIKSFINLAKIKLNYTGDIASNLGGAEPQESTRLSCFFCMSGLPLDPISISYLDGLLELMSATLITVRGNSKPNRIQQR